jgi:glutamine---fructose-6-phosphate transaminase (isomerizing)
MCGVVGITSTNKPSRLIPPLFAGVRALEARGYDSAGIAVLNGKIHLTKRSGKLDPLMREVDSSVEGSVGIAHTRWATHGGATDNNAHPHVSHDGTVAVVHNGIIGNFQRLKDELLQTGIIFKSETDSEVIPNLIARALKLGAVSLVDAVKQVAPMLDGEYAFLAFSRMFPHELVGASLARPLIIGKNMVTETFALASHEIALAGCGSTEVSHLSDKGEIVLIGQGGRIEAYRQKRSAWKSIAKTFRPISVCEESLSKGEYRTFMEKEIDEQSATLTHALAGRIANRMVNLSLPQELKDAISVAPFITVAACGTSLNALKVSKLLFEKLARLPVVIENASEYRDKQPSVVRGSLFIAVSQSGETSDTVSALTYARKRGARTISITNAKASQLARSSDFDINVQAGPEQAVASTKAFTAQVATLLLLALESGVIRATVTKKKVRELTRALRSLPALIENVLAKKDEVKRIAEYYQRAVRMIVIGKGMAVPVAEEAALKVQEIAYLDCYGFAAGELKHGPLALVEKGVPMLALMPQGIGSAKTLQNVEQFSARGGDVIAVVTKGSDEERAIDRLLVEGKVRYVLTLPSVPEEISPMLAVLIAQLLSLYLGEARGNDIDHPRNLAKSVTVA